ncbi:G-box binding factor [Balamuthia mandrillaris]
MQIQKQAIIGVAGDKGWDKFTKRVLLDFCELCDAGEQRPEFWLACFYEVLFPFLEHLLATSSRRSPSSHRRNSQQPQSAVSLEEIRLRAPWLLSKIFLHYMGELWKADEFERLWMHALQFIETETVEKHTIGDVGFRNAAAPHPSPSKPSSLPANSALSEEFFTDATITPPQQQEKDKTQDGNDD